MLEAKCEGGKKLPVQENVFELIGRCFILQQDNDLKHTAKATKQFFKAKNWKIFDWQSQSPDLNIFEHAQPPKKAQGKYGGTISRGEHHQRRSSTTGAIYESQISSSRCMQRLCNQVLNMTNSLYILVLCPKHHDALKCGWLKYIKIPLIKT